MSALIVGEASGLAPVLENRQLARQATQTPRDLKSLRITRSSSLRTLQRIDGVSLACHGKSWLAYATRKHALLLLPALASVLASAGLEAPQNGALCCATKKVVKKTLQRTPRQCEDLDHRWSTNALQDQLGHTVTTADLER